MKITRREFLKACAGMTTGLWISQLGFDLSGISAYAAALKIQGAKEIESICAFCSVSCGLIIHTKDKKIINIEGDPDHPINQGSLCAKGAALSQWVYNPDRILSPLYRAPKASEWKKVSWEWALDRIARLAKDIRDRGFIQKNESAEVVNRVENIAHIGSAALDNEEVWLLQAVMRVLGLVYIEHQARI